MVADFQSVYLNTVENLSVNHGHNVLKNESTPQIILFWDYFPHQLRFHWKVSILSTISNARSEDFNAIRLISKTILRLFTET